MRRATRFMSIRSTARLNCRASRWSSVSFEITSVEMDLRLDVTHVFPISPLRALCQVYTPSNSYQIARRDSLDDLTAASMIHHICQTLLCSTTVSMSRCNECQLDTNWIQFYLISIIHHIQLPFLSLTQLLPAQLKSTMQYRFSFCKLTIVDQECTIVIEHLITLAILKITSRGYGHLVLL